jgi:hypothetical protein
VAERIVQGLNDPDNYVAFVKLLLKYGVGRSKVHADAGADGAKKRLPRMIFLNTPKDSLAKPGDPSKQMRIVGQAPGPPQGRAAGLRAFCPRE